MNQLSLLSIELRILSFHFFFHLVQVSPEPQILPNGSQAWGRCCALFSDVISIRYLSQTPPPPRGGRKSALKMESWGVGMLSTLLPLLLRILRLCFLLHGFVASHCFSCFKFPCHTAVENGLHFPQLIFFFSYRDIPMPLVSSGVEHGNLRELAFARMKDLGIQV